MSLNYKQCREKGDSKYARYKQGLQAVTKDPSKYVKDTADFVVIGAGTSGCVVASRLVEQRLGYKVLVIEAGPSDAHVNLQIQAPFQANLLWGRPVPGGEDQAPLPYTVDWGYLTAKQEIPSVYQSEPGKLLENPITRYPRGRVWGGSSSTNAMIYMRGLKDDYETWGKDFSHWNWAKCLRAFIMCETNSRPNVDINLHGTCGLLNVEDLKSPYPIVQEVVAAATRENIKHTNDFNGHFQAGAGLYQVTLLNGLRHSFADHFLKKTLDDVRVTENTLAGNNLHKLVGLNVVSNATVTRLMLEDGANGKKRVKYVEYFYEDFIYRVEVKREVILCAGSINSPQILMLSGIGPKEELAKHGIKVEVESNMVGQNLMDHPLFPVTFQVKSRDGGSSLATRVIPTSNGSEAGITFKANLDGEMPTWTSTDDFHAKHDGSSKDKNPDIQMSVAPAIWDGFILAKAEQKGIVLDGVTIAPCLNEADSLGTITLDENEGTNPFKAPILSMNYYKDPNDMRKMVSAIKLAMKIGQNISPEWEAKLLTFDPEWTDPDYGDGKENDQLERFIRKRTSTSFHPSSTTRIGKTIADGVVDEKLRVFGVENMRIADAGIFPKIPRGNLNAPVGMCAYRCADFIFADEHTYAHH